MELDATAVGDGDLGLAALFADPNDSPKELLEVVDRKFEVPFRLVDPGADEEDEFLPEQQDLLPIVHPEQQDLLPIVHPEQQDLLPFIQDDEDEYQFDEDEYHEDEDEYQDEEEETEHNMPWVAKEGASRRKTRKAAQARKGGIIMTPDGLGSFSYGSFGASGRREF